MECITNVYVSLQFQNVSECCIHCRYTYLTLRVYTLGNSGRCMAYDIYVYTTQLYNYSLLYISFTSFSCVTWCWMLSFKNSYSQKGCQNIVYQSVTCNPTETYQNSFHTRLSKVSKQMDLYLIRSVLPETRNQAQHILNQVIF